jgi:hypothetical protein
VVCDEESQKKKVVERLREKRKNAHEDKAVDEPCHGPQAVRGREIYFLLRRTY